LASVRVGDDLAVKTYLKIEQPTSMYLILSSRFFGNIKKNTFKTNNTDLNYKAAN
jgi:hypothetical protein